jgi:hypothetical protein
MDKFLSQLTLDELKALMAATGTGDHSLVPPRNGLAPSRSAKSRGRKPARTQSARHNDPRALLQQHIIRSEYQSLKTDKARDRFLDRLSSSELHTLMVTTLNVDLLKERIGS